MKRQEGGGDEEEEGDKTGYNLLSWDAEVFNQMQAQASLGAAAVEVVIVYHLQLLPNVKNYRFIFFLPRQDI